jgi:leader peptidase (prepilin peptidase)/N-methyltransferase
MAAGDTWVIVLMAAVGLVSGYLMSPELGRSQVQLPPAVPMLTSALLLAVAGWRAGGNWRIIGIAVMVLTIVAVSIVDIARYRIPDRMLFPGLGVTAAVLVVGSVIDGDSGAIGRAAIGALTFTAVLLVLHLVSPAGMGFGDVKLALLLGLGCGWAAAGLAEAARNALLALMIGSLAGVAIGGALYLLRRLGVAVLTDPDEPDKLTTFPFGPALCLGALVMILA